MSLYTIDASGLNPMDGFSAEDRYGADPTAASIGRRNLQDSLTYMADATGGLSIVNTNDIREGLERISEDMYSYYSIGYTVSTGGADRVHRIEVELPGHPKYELRHRRRFIEKALETKVQDRVLSSLLIDIDDNPMELDLDAGRAAPATGERWTVPLELLFPLDRVALIPEGDVYVGRVTVFLGARDVNGRQSELQRQEHQIRIPEAQLEQARGTRASIELGLLLDEGQQRVAVGLMDTVTRQASYQRVTLSVP